jgi:tRNA(fMet)-specific endonuclease VapC
VQSDLGIEPLFAQLSEAKSFMAFRVYLQEDGAMNLNARANGVLASISCDPMTSGVADQYATIKRAAELAGTPVADNDLWIAATAANFGATLVTRDRAFRHITSLAIQDWSI